MAPVPDLSNVATPTKAIITIPITLYGCGNSDDAEAGAPERRRDGREHREHKADKARRCSRPTGPLRAGVAQHSSSSQRSPGPRRAPIPYPDETFTIVVVVSSETSLDACAPSSPGRPSYSRRITGTRSSMLKLGRQVKDEARQSPVRFLEYLFLPEG